MTLYDTTQPAHVSDRRSWSVGLIEIGARAREDTPELQLLAIFDVLDDLFRRGDPHARLFVEALATIAERGTLNTEHTGIQEEFRLLLDTLILEAQFVDGPELASSWRLLISGVISRAVRGDHDAALRAKRMGSDLVVHHRPASTLVREAAPALDADDFLDFDAYSDLGSHGFENMPWH